MKLDPSELSQKNSYNLLISAILPRPIAWVSSMDESGGLNLAPFSFFTVVSTKPMTLIFCPTVSGSSAPGQVKDTLRNVRNVPEFVVNITDEQTAEKMNLTATVLPSGQSEFDWAGLTPAPSEIIRVPRVAEAPLSFECKLRQIVTISDSPGGGSAVFGDVQYIHIRDDIFDDGYVQTELLKPIGRLARSSYVRVTDTFDMVRVRHPK